MNAADVLAKQEIARLDERIVAAQRLLLADGSISEAERSRFVLYINKLQARRAEIEAAQQEPAAVNGDEMLDMTEARVNNVEATLRLMDDRLTRIVEQIHQLDVRTGRLEDAVGLLKDGQKATTEQVRNLADTMNSHGPQYSRMYLVGGALVMTVILVLLLILTWRLL
jgi:chromosome segregation ATPase